MRNPRSFTKPLSIGAPAPPADVPDRPSRMIHFFDPSNPRMAAKVPDLVPKVDVLLANLEDAIDIEKKVAAREGLIKIAQATDFGETQFWTRINSLDSP
jgi:malyl-CoA/(S)-citramalyl-CoA lyase